VIDILTTQLLCVCVCVCVRVRVRVRVRVCVCVKDKKYLKIEIARASETDFVQEPS
jgi:hypothetical protein